VRRPVGLTFIETACLEVNQVKRMLAIAFAISFAVAMLISPIRGRAATGQTRICRPTQEELQACEEAGGIFDYGLCKCRIF
jgi:hypothetical protein